MSTFDVHRLRFGDWMPSPIKAIASDPFSAMVAIGREDGDIEISDSTGKWFTAARIPGRCGFALKSLVWSSLSSERGRLFGVSLRGFLFEIDLAALTFKNVQESYGGAIWCISARSTQPTLAVGCEDGTIRIFSYADGALEYSKVFSGAGGSRVLCMAHHPSKGELFAGCADGTISCLDADTGRPIYTMTGDLMRGASTLIWSLIVLSDSTVITGDNRGHVQFLDGSTGVLMVSFHQHTAEVLALAASPDETQVYASGVDCRVTCMRRIKHRSASFGAASEADESGKYTNPQVVDNHWVYTASHRPHSHDVFALAVCKNAHIFGKQKSKGASGEAAAEHRERSRPLLLSGGQDCKLCAYSIDDFIATRPAWILPIPANGLVSKSSDYKSVAVKHRNHVDVWAVALHAPQSAKGGSTKKRKIGEAELETCTLALRIELQGAEHIHTFALSPCGKFLGMSGHFGFRMWSVVPASGKESKAPLSCHKIDLPELKDTFAHAICFSADGCRLAVCTDKGKILLLNVGADKASKKPRVSVRHTFDHYRTINENRNVDADDRSDAAQSLKFAVKDVVLSSDGLYLSVSDCAHGVYVYELDRLRLYWKLPACTHVVTSIAFLPNDPSNLVVLLAEGILVYNLNSMNLTPWSESNRDRIHHLLNKASSPLHAVVFDPASSSRLFLHGQGMCVQVDMSQPAPKRSKLVTPFLGEAEVNVVEEEAEERGGSGSGKKSKQQKKEENLSSNFSTVHAYRSVIDVGCLENQLVSAAQCRCCVAVVVVVAYRPFGPIRWHFIHVFAH
jgi:U3 small nucleolar RNA-associated protein 4